MGNYRSPSAPGCIYDGCSGKHYSRSVCQKHYARHKKAGTVPTLPSTPIWDPWERFLLQVDVGLCWEWTGPTKPDGYAQFFVDGRRQYVHRYAWEHLTLQKIPPGMTIDHLCQNKICVNTDHMEVVTRAENIRRCWKNRSRAAQFRRKADAA